LQFSLQADSPETFGYTCTLDVLAIVKTKFMILSVVAPCGVAWWLDTIVLVDRVRISAPWRWSQWGTQPPHCRAQQPKAPWLLPASSRFTVPRVGPQYMDRSTFHSINMGGDRGYRDYYEHNSSRNFSSNTDDNYELVSWNPYTSLSERYEL